MKKKDFKVYRKGYLKGVKDSLDTEDEKRKEYEFLETCRRIRNELGCFYFLTNLEDLDKEEIKRFKKLNTKAHLERLRVLTFLLNEEEMLFNYDKQI